METPLESSPADMSGDRLLDVKRSWMARRSMTEKDGAMARETSKKEQSLHSVHSSGGTSGAQSADKKKKEKNVHPGATAVPGPNAQAWHRSVVMPINDEASSLPLIEARLVEEEEVEDDSLRRALEENEQKLLAQQREMQRLQDQVEALQRKNPPCKKKETVEQTTSKTTKTDVPKIKREYKPKAEEFALQTLLGKHDKDNKETVAPRKTKGKFSFLRGRKG